MKEQEFQIELSVFLDMCVFLSCCFMCMTIPWWFSGVSTLLIIMQPLSLRIIFISLTHLLNMYNECYKIHCIDLYHIPKEHHSQYNRLPSEKKLSKRKTIVCYKDCVFHQAWTENFVTMENILSIIKSSCAHSLSPTSSLYSSLSI